MLHHPHPLLLASRPIFTLMLVGSVLACVPPTPPTSGSVPTPPAPAPSASPVVAPTTTTIEGSVDLQLLDGSCNQLRTVAGSGWHVVARILAPEGATFADDELEQTLVADLTGRYSLAGVPLQATIQLTTHRLAIAGGPQSTVTVVTPLSPAPPLTVTIPCSSGTLGTITGTIFDDRGKPVDGARIIGRILGTGTFPNGSDSLATSSQLGDYTLAGLPDGQGLLVTAGKPGYASRQQIIDRILPVPDGQRLDFGDSSAGEDLYSLNDPPEVTAVSVTREGMLTLRFSEPVIRNQTQSQLAITLAARGVKAPFGYGPFWLSTSNTVLGGLGTDYNPITDRFGSLTLIDLQGALFDQESFMPLWSDDQTLVVSFRPGQALPSDRDSARVPWYALGFSGPLRDTTGGRARQDRFFRLHAGTPNRSAHHFTVAVDTTSPRLSDFTITNQPNFRDELRFRFSEPMVLTVKNQVNATVPAARAASSALNHDNFRVLGGNLSQPPTFDEAVVTGGTVSFAPEDPTHSTILWTMPGPNVRGEHVWQPGQVVWGIVSPTVTDPAGNPVASTNGAARKTAIVH